MKKRLLTLLIILGIILPYGQSLVYAMAQQKPLAENQLKLQTNTTEKQTVLDENYAKVTASYIETEANYQWTIEFEKKASQNESRIRIAIDTTANGFGTVSDIRGKGLSLQDADSNELKAMKVENDEKDLDWYYGEVYSTSAKTGVLTFTSEKASNDSGELPLIIAVDEQIPETESADDPQTSEQISDATSEQISESTEQTAEITEETAELANDSGISFYRSPIRAAGDLLKLGPFAPNDPFNYSNKSSQQRYLNHSTNHFARDGAENKGIFDSDGEYTTGGQGALYNGENIVTDEESLTVLENGQLKITNGGANWRNYDYASVESVEPGALPFAETEQLWGDKRTFTNSYLNYNGAYMKKWVEPITSHVEDNQNATTIYNVYLDVIGGVPKEKRPLDIVFVLDKSGSMDEKIPDGKTPNSTNSKFNIMKESLATTIGQLFDKKNLDLRVGFVDFGSKPGLSLFSNTFPLNADRLKVLGEDNTVLYGGSKADYGGGTPLSLGIKNGYAALYKDFPDPNREAEKILIVVGDGLPTYSHSGFRHNKSATAALNEWKNDHETISEYWDNNLNSPCLHNYEDTKNDDYSSKFEPDERYPKEFDSTRRPNDDYGGIGKPETHFYRYGETDNLSLTADEKAKIHWYGTGRPDPVGPPIGQPTAEAKTLAQEYNKQNAVHTIAYHHWLKKQYKDAPRVFTIGLGLSSPSSSTPTNNEVYDALGRNVLKNIADLKLLPKTENESHYYGADTQKEFIDALDTIVNDFAPTIQNATLYDETGTNVSLYNAGAEASISYYHLNPSENGSKVKYKEPIEWNTTEHGPEPKVTVEGPYSNTNQNHAYKFRGISLGEGEMMRIKYQAKLDAGAQDGKFYTVNNQAYLINAADAADPELARTNRMYLPSPSIRYVRNDRTLRVKKTDEDGNGIKGVKLGLYTKKEEEYKQIDSAETDDSGTAIFSKHLNVLDNKDSEIYYVKEIDAPAHFEVLPDYLAFQIRKNLGDDPNEIEHYELTEKTSGTLGDKYLPDDDLWPYYYKGPNHTFTIVQTLTEGDIKQFDKLYVNLDLTNKLKPIEVSISKTIEGTDKAPLPGATFELQKGDANGENYTKFAEGSSDATGKVTFNVHLEQTAGQDYTYYRIVETVTPEGYEKPSADTYWSIQLDHKNKKIKYQRNGDKEWKEATYESLAKNNSKIHLALDITNEMVKRDFLIKKVDNEGNPLNGVGFEIKKTDADEVFKAYSGISDYKNGAIVREDGIGAFFSKKSGAKKYEDQDYTNRLKLTAGTYTVKETDSLVGYTGLLNEIKFELTTDGKFEFEGKSGFEVSKNGQLLTLTVKNNIKPLALEFQKMDSHSNRPVAGAKFEIAQWDAAGWGTEQELANFGEDGTLFRLDPLEVGRYKIKETTPPEGYRAFPGHLELEVSIREKDETIGEVLYEKGSIKAEFAYFKADENGDMVEVKNSRQLIELAEVTEGEVNKVLVKFDVENDPTFPLPSTGGQGRMGYYLITALLVSAMLILGFYYYRRTQRRE